MYLNLFKFHLENRGKQVMGWPPLGQSTLKATFLLKTGSLTPTLKLDICSCFFFPTLLSASKTLLTLFKKTSRTIIFILSVL